MNLDRPELASRAYWIGRFDGLVTGGLWGFFAGFGLALLCFWWSSR